MKLCFPVVATNGLESQVFNHFGSAKHFVVVDTETNGFSSISNGDLEHTHGACNPLQALSGTQVDGVITGGIGAGALNGLNRMNIRVFSVNGTTIADNLAQFNAGNLKEMVVSSCGQHGGHGAGSGCGCSH